MISTRTLLLGAGRIPLIVCVTRPCLPILPLCPLRTSHSLHRSSVAPHAAVDGWGGSWWIRVLWVVNFSSSDRGAPWPCRLHLWVPELLNRMILEWCIGRSHEKTYHHQYKDHNLIYSIHHPSRFWQTHFPSFSMNFKEAFFGPLNVKPGFSLAILRCQAADFGGWCDQQKLFRCGKLDGTVQVQEKLAKEAGLLEVPCFYSDWPPGRMEKLCRIKKLCTRICSFKWKSLKTAVLIQLPEVAGWVALLQLEVWITEDFVHLYSHARTHLNILDFTRYIDVWHQHIILSDASLPF